MKIVINKSIIYKNDETGLVVQPSDPVALQQAMRYLWVSLYRHTAKKGKRAEAILEALYG